MILSHEQIQELHGNEMVAECFCTSAEVCEFHKATATALHLYDENERLKARNIHVLIEDLEKAAAENERLREALAPLVREEPCWSCDGDGCDVCADTGLLNADVDPADVQRARAALKPSVSAGETIEEF